MKLSDLDKIKKLSVEWEKLRNAEVVLEAEMRCIDFDFHYSGSGVENKYRFLSNSGCDLDEMRIGIRTVITKQREQVQTKLMMMGVTDFEGKV